MQKIFKIEKLDPLVEFKKVDRLSHGRRKKVRINKKLKAAHCDRYIQKLIKRQTKLHNEEKELLQKREMKIWSPVEISETANFQPENPEADLKKIETTETVETNESVCLNNQSEEVPQEINPLKLISQIDQGIIQSLQFNDFVQDDLKKIKEKGPRDLLPPATENTPEYWLVLDLDETLVHWSISPFEGYDEVLNNIYISYRPYLLEFLEKVSQFFEVVVFTASESAYANMVMDRFDPQQKYIHHKLFRESCLEVYGNYIKDLAVLGRDVDKTIIVDNSMVSFILNLESAIPIESYQGDKQDTELYKLAELMVSAINTPPVEKAQDRPNLREYFASIFKMENRFSFWRDQIRNGFEGLRAPFSR